jgi:hypothetical protein
MLVRVSSSWGTVMINFHHFDVKQQLRNNDITISLPALLLSEIVLTRTSATVCTRLEASTVDHADLEDIGLKCMD